MKIMAERRMLGDYGMINGDEVNNEFSKTSPAPSQ